MSSSSSSSSSSRQIDTAAFATRSTTPPNRSEGAFLLSPIRILCFGDSLTEGTTAESSNPFPYAPHLEAALQPSAKQVKRDIMVRHKGFPGWTAEELYQERSGQSRVLQTYIRNVQDPSLSMVVLLAGTNDLGSSRSPAAIVRSLIDLHTFCRKDEHVPHTLAIGVPPSAYQSVNAEATADVKTINEKLQAWCSSSSATASTIPGTTTFVPFPFEYSDAEATTCCFWVATTEAETNWSSDGLHLSPRGYRVLGESLVPTIQELLLQNDDEQGSRGGSNSSSSMYSYD